MDTCKKARFTAKRAQQKSARDAREAFSGHGRLVRGREEASILRPKSAKAKKPSEQW